MGVQPDIQGRHDFEVAGVAPSRRAVYELLDDHRRVAGERRTVLRRLPEVAEVLEAQPLRNLVGPNTGCQRALGAFHLGRHVVLEPDQIVSGARAEVAGDHVRGLEVDQALEHLDPHERAPLPHRGAGVVHEHIARDQESLPG